MKKVYEDAAAQGGKKIGYAAGLVVAAGLGLAFVSAPTAAMALDEGADSAVRVQAVEAVDVDGARTATSQEVASVTVSQTAAGDAASSDAAASDSVTPSEGATGGAAAEGDKAATDGPSDGSAEGNKKPGQPEAGGPSTETDGSKADGSGSGAGGGVAEGGSGAKADGSGSESDAGAAEGEAGAKPGPAGAEAGVAAAPGAGLPSAAPAAPAATASGWHDGRYYGADGNLYTGWVVREDFVDEARGQGLQRYWLQDGAIQRDRTVETEKGWWVRVLRQGYVLRGAYRDAGGELYWADNDGRLWGEGWFVGDIGQGLQRYYVADGHHTEAEGYSTKGYAHYTTSKGYVLRGVHTTSAGKTYYADNDGKAARSTWVVANNLVSGTGLQRYWFDADGQMAKNRLIDKDADIDRGAGYYAWATGNGTILRSAWDNDNGRVYLADNDGRLATTADGKDGWIVTGAYTGGALQRYYIDSTDHAAMSGFFVVKGYGYIYGLGGKGYVMRGKSTWGSHMFLADNDGRLATTSGWLVTGTYDGGALQRYYLDLVPGVNREYNFYAAKLGSFTVGSDKYYGREDQGYVVRGRYVTPGNVLIIADNDGKISYNLNGIDIASYQNGIDLSALDVDFVIIKATQGTSYTFNNMKKYADQALSLNKKLGFYHFVDTRVGAEAQADYFVNAVRDYVGQAVLFLDWENNDMNGQNNLSAGTNFAKAFLDRVYQKTGVKPLIYTSRAVVHQCDWSSVANSGYGLWVAQYPYKYYDTNGYKGFAENPGTIGYGGHSSSDFGAWGSKPTIWQYTSTGVLNGWRGQLDLNVFFGSSSDWDNLAKRA